MVNKILEGLIFFNHCADPAAKSRVAGYLHVVLIYLTDNAEVALAHAISDIALVPTKLTVGKKPYGEYVRMTDTF